MLDLTGKKALVTGATGGLGGAIARRLHAQGATVALSGTRVEALEALAKELGERAEITPCDLSDRDSVEALQLPLDARLLLYRTFERQVMADHASLVEMINATMAADGLLPALRYVPTRMRAPTSVAASTRDKREPQQQHESQSPRASS